MSARGAATPAKTQSSGGIIDTLQSLIVAFVFAMAFRGFVLEGFVIPTGSMAPTLMGAHIRVHSPATGYEYAVDASEIVMAQQMGARRNDRPIFDPMISRQSPVVALPGAELAAEARMGDRVLVLKYLAPLTHPARWDVAVFKNPTDPVGDAPYYIKRMVGMPNETLLVADGDVFTGAVDAKVDDLRIARKPEMVQRAVWLPVYDSDFQPADIARLEAAIRQRWRGSPWRPSDGWDTRDTRVWSWSKASPASLSWNNEILPLDDWNAYNAYRRDIPLYPVADLAIAAAIDAENPAAFRCVLDLGARGRIFRFGIGAGVASLSVIEGESQKIAQTVEFPFAPTASGATRWAEPMRLELWHVDQRMSLFLNGEELGSLEYDLGGPVQRILASHFGRTLEQYVANPTGQRPTPPTLSWRFEGSPFTLRHVSVQRDLYYRPDFLSANNQFPSNGTAISGLAFATDPMSPARLGPEDYVMFGDNSGASKDSRLWGRSHPLVVRELGNDHPFIVPREMLIGKAWSVYFPAPVAMTTGGRAFIPDFGRLRFIR
jgi:signal peptidase I